MKKLNFKKISIKSRRGQKPVEEGVIPPKRKRRLLRFIGSFFVIFLGLFAIALIAAPRYALYDMNKRLTNMPGYTAHVGDLSIDYLTLTAKAKNIYIRKKNGKIKQPMIYVSQSTVNLDMDAWDAGITATRIVVDTIVINLVSSHNKELSQMPTDSAFADVMKELMPLERNRLEIKHGTVTYYDNKHIPNAQIVLNDLYIKGENLLNISDSTAQLPGRMQMRANIYGATLSANIKVNAKSKVPMFDVTATLSKLNLVNVNHLLTAYAKFDVHKGYFSMSTEMATKNNRIFGYVKPVIDELDIFDRKSEKEESGKDKQRERWYDFGAWLFKNKKEDKISTTIEIDGPLKDPNINIWQIIGEAITQSATSSLLQGLDNSVGINSVGGEHKKGFLEKLLTKKEPKENKKEEKPEKKKDRKKKDK
ncbi:MAG: DUF748 domain-containing protein [Sphingobacteriales bacterium JAD_PAG50586_3]|nr:MAG: DUF748 domain-containing protein [Sphingobacteriales bacterium JAD_PAG50586_3]